MLLKCLLGGDCFYCETQSSLTSLACRQVSSDSFQWRLRPWMSDCWLSARKRSKEKKTFPSFLDFSILVWINVALHLRKRELTTTTTTTTCVDYFSFGISIRYETQVVLMSGQQGPSASSEQTWGVLGLVWFGLCAPSESQVQFVHWPSAGHAQHMSSPTSISSESKWQKTRHL